MNRSYAAFFAPGSPTARSPTGTSRSSSLTVDPRATKRDVASRGTLASREGTSRAHSVAALVLQTAPTFASNVALRVSVSSIFNTSVRIEAKGLAPEGGAGLPEAIAAGTAVSAAYVHSSSPLPLQTKGNIEIENFEPIPFALAHVRQQQTFVGSPGRRRCTVLKADKWDWRGGGEKPTEGLAADLELVGVQLRVHLREATAAELRRCLQLQALREAEQDQDYDTLHAQVTKAKTAGVELEHIERGEERLKVLRLQGLHVNVGCSKEVLREMMQWSRVTNRNGATTLQEACRVDADCPCNRPGSPCEVLEVVPSAVQEILGSGGDQLLFEELSGAALDVQEGSVWKSGGKYIFSAFNRNQSLVALTRMLDNHGRRKCAKLLLELADVSEKKYAGYVTAVQVNFHPNGDTYHDQHRDIYSGKQRAGPNCTCSFRECVGTVCYSVGSSRLCLLETMVDDLSSIKPCCESCQGCRERRWLHSGEAMYFNAPWNQNHMHGIPPMPEDSGPRISVAFLLGAKS